MRNLQKILALVLALVMSLSLMATAGATDFSDDAEIDETFRESVDVLNGLKVFQGYDNGAYFSPKGDITRAEVAAIIYRIATGDVTDSQVKIYADYNKFSDVPSDHWAAGYINYCTNAEYIKGRGDGKFYPSDKVTGYEALAMILRVVGYDKNGEFTGADWQVQTAATANQRKVTKNVNAGTLGNPASRETVAELLCQAILIEKVNYTLAFGYQISTDPQETIAYETFKMEKLEGVVTGNEIADLKTDKGTALGANQTRLVIDGREEVMNIPTGLDDIGECVRVYIRPENGTTRSNLVTSKVYSEGLNREYTTSDRKSSISGIAAEEGITSLEGAEHFINFDQAHKWEARSVIRYTIEVRMSQYDAMVMYNQNGGKLTGLGVYASQNDAPAGGPFTYISKKPINENWDRLIRTSSGATYKYEKTIDAFTDLTDRDYNNIRSIFTNANYVNNVVKGEVYVGTSSRPGTDDVSDDIRWEDFVNTYLKSEENKDQIDSNGQGYLLKIIDNDMDGIAEYVLQTRYTVAKIAANGTSLDIGSVRFTDADTCNEVSASESVTSVSGTDLAASEETLAAGDVVIYAKIDGKIRAQKAETETSRVTSINRNTNPVTATIESGEKKQSAVHTHSQGLAYGLTNMVIGTNYTVYFDLFGNVAAFQEGEVGKPVLITDGWFNQTATGREYAIQAYVDGAIKTVNITNNGELFIAPQTNAYNNSWGNLKTNFGTTPTNSTKGNVNYDGEDIHTIVAYLEDNNLVPVDKSYRVNQTLRMIALPDNSAGIPTRDNGVTGKLYETTYGVNNTIYNTQYNTAYTTPDAQVEATVYGRADTVYYYVYRDGTLNTVTGQPNVVVRTYTGYSSIPNINSVYIDDVYAVGSRTTQNTGSVNPHYVYTADVVVVELKENYKYQNSNSEQVFIPGLTVVNNSVARVAGYGIETIPMIRGNGEYQTDVQVDLTHSTGYNQAGGRGNIVPGLYYMDPTDTNPNLYTIRKMTPADIRANNYLTGYVSQNTVWENNWVLVDVQMQGKVTDYRGVEVDHPLGSKLGTVGKNVNTENLYTLSHGTGINSAATLTKAPASTVFDQWSQWNQNNTNANVLNELYDVTTNTFPDGTDARSNRNEVLVRYDGSNIVWAISFAELSGSDMDYAQTIWYDNLVENDNLVGSGLEFFGNRGLRTGSGTPTDPYRITVKYADAKDPILDLTKHANAATISTYTLTKWVKDANDYAQPIDTLEKEAAETVLANVGGAQYKLVVNFVSGGSETYYLTLESAAKTGELKQAPGVPDNTVIDTDTRSLKVPGDAVSLPNYVAAFAVDEPNATVTWTFVQRTLNGDEDTIVLNSRMDGTHLKVTNPEVLAGRNDTTTETVSVTAVVTAQDGKTVTDTRTYQADDAKFAVINLHEGVVASYNGKTYTGDATPVTFKAVRGDLVNVKPATAGEYGKFVKNDNTSMWVEYPEGKTDWASFVVPDGTTNRNVHIKFVSTAANNLTSDTENPTIQSGKVNNVSGNVTVPLDAPVTISDNTTIDLQDGSTLTLQREGDGLHVAAGKKLTIKGTGTLKLDGTGSLIGLKGGELEIGAATLEAGGTYAISLFGDENVGGPSKVTLNGTKINGNYGLFLNGGNSKANVWNLNDVTVNTKGICLYLAGKGTTVINGGSFTAGAEDAAIEVRAGTVSVIGADVTSNNPSYSVRANGNGSTTSGAAIAVAPHTTYNPVNVTVDGGTYTGAMAVSVANPQSSTGGCTVTVNATLKTLSGGNGSYSVTVPVGVAVKPAVSINGTQVPVTEVGASAPSGGSR